jgi:peroxiredoxin
MRLAAAIVALLAAPLLARQEPPPEPAPEPPPQAEPEAAPSPATPTPPSATPDRLATLAGTEEAKAILRRVLDLATTTRTLRFHSRTTNSGSLATHAADVEADVWMRRGGGASEQWELRITGKAVRSSQPEPTVLDVVWGPTRIAWLDHAAKQLVERARQQGGGPIVQAALSAIPSQLLERRPLGREITAKLVTVEGSEDVGGVRCTILAFQYKTATSRTRLWVAESDGFPRRFERSSEIKNFSSGTIVEFSDLSIDEPIPEDRFNIALPDGYQRRTLSTLAKPGASAPATHTITPDPAPAPDPTDTPPETHAEIITTPRAATDPAPAFDLATPDGTRVTLQSLRGEIVVLYFWGTWSLSGMAGLSEAQALHDDLKDAGVRVLALSLREKDRDGPAEYFRDNALTATLLLGADRAAADYRTSRYPTFVVIDAQGNRVGEVAGYSKDTTPAAVRALIDKARGMSTRPDRSPGAPD